MVFKFRLLYACREINPHLGSSVNPCPGSAVNPRLGSPVYSCLGYHCRFACMHDQNQTFKYLNLWIFLEVQGFHFSHKFVNLFHFVFFLGDLYLHVVAATMIISILIYTDCSHSQTQSIHSILDYCFFFPLQAQF